MAVMTCCPSLSPVTGKPCVFPDFPEAHYLGHESALHDGSQQSWATTTLDHDRWRGVKALGVSDAARWALLWERVNRLPTTAQTRTYATYLRELLMHPAWERVSPEGSRWDGDWNEDWIK